MIHRLIERHNFCFIVHKYLSFSLIFSQYSCYGCQISQHPACLKLLQKMPQLKYIHENLIYILCSHVKQLPKNCTRKKYFLSALMTCKLVFLVLMIDLSRKTTTKYLIAFSDREIQPSTHTFMYR